MAQPALWHPAAKDEDGGDVRKQLRAGAPGFDAQRPPSPGRAFGSSIPAPPSQPRKGSRPASNHFRAPGNSGLGSFSVTAPSGAASTLGSYASNHTRRAASPAPQRSGGAAQAAQRSQSPGPFNAQPRSASAAPQRPTSNSRYRPPPSNGSPGKPLFATAYGSQYANLNMRAAGTQAGGGAPVSGQRSGAAIMSPYRSRPSSGASVGANGAPAAAVAAASAAGARASTTTPASLARPAGDGWFGGSSKLAVTLPAPQGSEANKHVQELGQLLNVFAPTSPHAHGGGKVAANFRASKYVQPKQAWGAAQEPPHQQPAAAAAATGGTAGLAPQSISGQPLRPSTPSGGGARPSAAPAYMHHEQGPPHAANLSLVRLQQQQHSNQQSQGLGPGAPYLQQQQQHSQPASAALQMQGAGQAPYQPQQQLQQQLAHGYAVPPTANITFGGAAPSAGPAARAAPANGVHGPPSAVRPAAVTPAYSQQGAQYIGSASAAFASYAASVGARSDAAQLSTGSPPRQQSGAAPAGVAAGGGSAMAWGTVTGPGPIRVPREPVVISDTSSANSLKDTPSSSFSAGHQNGGYSAGTAASAGGAVPNGVLPSGPSMSGPSGSGMARPLLGLGVAGHPTGLPPPSPSKLPPAGLGPAPQPGSTAVLAASAAASKAFMRTASSRSSACSGGSDGVAQHVAALGAALDQDDGPSSSASSTTAAQQIYPIPTAHHQHHQHQPQHSQQPFPQPVAAPRPVMTGGILFPAAIRTHSAATPSIVQPGSQPGTPIRPSSLSCLELLNRRASTGSPFVEGDQKGVGSPTAAAAGRGSDMPIAPASPAFGSRLAAHGTLTCMRPSTGPSNFAADSQPDVSSAFADGGGGGPGATNSMTSSPMAWHSLRHGSVDGYDHPQGVLLAAAAAASGSGTSTATPTKALPHSALWTHSAPCSNVPSPARQPQHLLQAQRSQAGARAQQAAAPGGGDGAPGTVAAHQQQQEALSQRQASEATAQPVVVPPAGAAAAGPEAVTGPTSVPMPQDAPLRPRTATATNLSHALNAAVAPSPPGGDGAAAASAAGHSTVVQPQVAPPQQQQYIHSQAPAPGAIAQAAAAPSVHTAAQQQGHYHQPHQHAYSNLNPNSQQQQQQQQQQHHHPQALVPPPAPRFNPASALGCDPLPEYDGLLPGYSVGKVIGEGGFCQVRLAVHHLSQRRVAVKVIDKQKLSDPNEAKRMQREIRVMKHLSHQCVIKLFEVIDTPKQLFLVMEHAPSGSLLDYVRARKRLSEHDACLFFQQIVASLEYCHAREVVHRDIKLENILMDAENRMKLIDFGLSAFYVAGKRLRVHCGSPSYAAPEIVARKAYEGPPVDVWSLGVVLFAMVAGYLPFHASGGNKQELCNKIMAGTYTAPDHLSSSMKDLLARMLTVDPDRRITFPEVWHHAWVRSGPQWSDRGVNVYAVSLDPGAQGGLRCDQQVVSELESAGYPRTLVYQHLASADTTYVTASYFLLCEGKAEAARRLKAGGSGGKAGATRSAPGSFVGNQVAAAQIAAAVVKTSDRNGGGGGGGAYGYGDPQSQQQRSSSVSRAPAPGGQQPQPGGGPPAAGSAGSKQQQPQGASVPYSKGQGGHDDSALAFHNPNGRVAMVV